MMGQAAEMKEAGRIYKELKKTLNASAKSLKRQGIPYHNARVYALVILLGMEIKHVVHGYSVLAVKDGREMHDRQEGWFTNEKAKQVGADLSQYVWLEVLSGLKEQVRFKKGTLKRFLDEKGIHLVKKQDE